MKQWYKEWYQEWFKRGFSWQSLGCVWGAALVTLGVAFIPLYVWRGSYFGDPGVARLVEDILMTVIGLVGGFLVLMLIQSRREDVLIWDKRTILLDAAGGVVLYSILWFVAGVGFRNNYLVAFCGYHLSNLLIERLNFEPERLAFALSVLVYGPVYFAAMLLGPKLAVRRARRVYKGTGNWGI